MVVKPEDSQYICLNCDGSFVEPKFDMVHHRTKYVCPHCGSDQIKCLFQKKGGPIDPDEMKKY